jgi:hypothetical protein
MMDGGNQGERQQTRDQKSPCKIHDRLDHEPRS